MPSMNISLPEQMKDWVEARLESGQYHNSSEYIRDLIRRDQQAQARDEAFRAAIQAGRDSGDDTRGMEEILAEALQQVES